MGISIVSKDRINFIKSNIQKKQDSITNRGGFLGGAKYVGGSILAGVGSIGEGVIDAVMALGADLTGNHDFAESLFEHNVVGDWHADLAEEYNPTGVMSFIGDVTRGVGQSATLLIPYAGVPLFISGVASQGVSDAAAKTGDVGIKEAGYGITSGVIEGALESALGWAGKGGNAVLSSLTKGTIKSTAKTAVRKGLVSTVLSNAASEFLEESVSEVIDTGLQNIYKIDPGKKLNWNDVLYSGAVGAVSGGVMGGVGKGFSDTVNLARGEKILKNGNSQTLVNTANLVADRIAAKGTDFKNASDWVTKLRASVDAYNSLVKDGKQDSR